MKNKAGILHFLFGLLISFTIVFQASHGFIHLDEHFSESICHHDKGSHKAIITHEHAKHENCSICSFAFYPSISSEKLSFEIQKTTFEFHYFSFYNSNFHSFSKATVSLRGPPFRLFS